MDTQTGQDMVVRNGLAGRGFWFVMSLAMGFIATCMLILACTQVFPLTPFHANRLLNGVWWLVAAVSFASGCRWCWRVARHLGFTQAQMDAEGVAFRLGTHKSPLLVRMPWAEISAVERRRGGNNMGFYQVTTRDGAFAKLSAANFWRPTKLAKTIAARAGCPIVKV